MDQQPQRLLRQALRELCGGWLPGGQHPWFTRLAGMVGKRAYDMQRWRERRRL